MQLREFDVVIIGGGPAGLTAGLYSARAGKSTALLEQLVVGGQAALTSEIENYPAIDRISGFELGLKMEKQARSFGMQTLYETALSVDLSQKLITTNKGVIGAKAIILCMGAQSRKLEVEGENEFAGRGVSYCATCDGAFFKDKEVVVTGGGNTAVSDALYLKNIAKKVTLIHRRNVLRATKVLADRLLNDSSIEKIWGANIERLEGTDELKNVVIRQGNGSLKSLAADAIFVAIGSLPRNELVKHQLVCDEFGYIKTNEDMSVPNYNGIYAAGDIRSKTLRQVVTACADGAIAGELAASE